MRRIFGPSFGAVLGVLALIGPAVKAQAPPDPSYRRVASYPSPHALLTELRRIGALARTEERSRAVDGLWQTLKANGQVPFAVGDSVVWLYRGEARAVAWAGDMNGWSPRWTGARVPGTDVWWRRDRLPGDGRFDYKVIVDGEWQQDPSNPLTQFSGTGATNSEVRMPAYRFPAETLPLRRGGGRLSPVRTMDSRALGYAVNYRVYTPAGYTARAAPLPVLVATDGHEFAHEALGALVHVLDRSIAAREVAPVLVVFVDPRDPATGRNRRQEELVPSGAPERLCNPCRADRFLAFLAEELLPAVEQAYRARATGEDRAILGTSLGGLFAAYAITERPDVFRHAGIYSPAFWPLDAIYARFPDVQPAAQRLFVAQGTRSDGDGGDKLAAYLNPRSYAYTYLRRNEGHSWGHWRGIQGAMLRTLFPGPAVQASGAPGAVRR